jgi:large subunit ribosomal protein L19
MMLQSVSGRAAARPFTASRRCVVPQASQRGLAPLVKELGDLQLKASPPKVTIGDSVRFGLAVQEGKGKTRTQNLEGVVIAEAGHGINKTVTIRRVFQGVGVEFVIPVHSPQLQAVTVVRSGRVRRAKLFYLRERFGKNARLKDRAAKVEAKAE